MPKFNTSDVIRIILNDIHHQGLLACPDTIDECNAILRTKADGTMKLYKERTAAFLKLIGGDLNEDCFKLMLSRIINSKELKAILIDFVMYGSPAIFETYESTFKEAFAGGIDLNKNENINDVSDAISNIKVILDQEKIDRGDIALKNGVIADNKMISSYIIRGIRSLDRITPIVDEIGADMTRKMDMSIDYVGYREKVNIILSFIGEDLDDALYRQMLSNIRRSPRMQTIIVAASRYMDMKLLRERMSDLKYAFTGELTDINFLDEEQNDAFTRIETDLITRKANMEKKSYAASKKELEVLANVIIAGSTEADPIVDRAINNVLKLDRLNVASDNMDYLRHNFNREPAANETPENTYTNKLHIFLSIIGAQLSAEDYEMFVLSLKSNEEAQSFVDACIRYCDFDGLYSKRIPMQVYLISDYKTVIKGASPIDAYKIAKKYVDKMQEEFEEKQTAINEGKLGINIDDEKIDPELINNEVDEIDYNSDDYINYDDINDRDDGNDANEIEEANYQRNVESAKEKDMNAGNEILSQAIIIHDKAQRDAINVIADAGTAFIVGGVFFAGINLLHENLTAYKTRFIETQSNKEANFGNYMIKDIEESGSTTYRNMTAALNAVTRGTDLIKNDDIDVNLSLNELLKGLNTLKAAATEYYKSHTGLRGIFKGYSAEGKERIALAKGIIESTSKEIDKLKDYAKVSKISLDSSPDAKSIRGMWNEFKSNHTEFTDEHIKVDSKANDDIRAEINNWNDKIRVKELAREKVNGIASIMTREERLDMLGIGSFEVGPTTFAKKYVANEYLNMIKLAETGDTTYTIEDIQNEILSSDFADEFYNKVEALASNPEFTKLIDDNPNTALKAWKAKEKANAKDSFEQRVAGSNEYKNLETKEPKSAKTKWEVAEHRIEVCKREWSKEADKINDIRKKIASPASPFKQEFGDDPVANKRIKKERKTYAAEVADTLGRTLTLSYLKDLYDSDKDSAMRIVLDPKQLKKIQKYFTEGITRDFLNGHVPIDKLTDKLDNFDIFKKQSLHYITEGQEREARANAPKPPKKVAPAINMNQPQEPMVLKPMNDYDNI